MCPERAQNVPRADVPVLSPVSQTVASGHVILYVSEEDSGTSTLLDPARQATSLTRLTWLTRDAQVWSCTCEEYI